MFAWFKSTGEIIMENVISAAELFEQSIQASRCQVEEEHEVWQANACAPWALLSGGTKFLPGDPNLSKTWLWEPKNQVFGDESDPARLLRTFAGLMPSCSTTGLLPLGHLWRGSAMGGSRENCLES